MKYKLLICDDEYFVIKGLRETIDWAELDVEIVGDCKNGRQALDAVHKFRPDLIISDIRMPIMDGLQLAEALAHENFDGAVIIYSGYGDFEYARKALDYGVTSYLLKPVDNESLKAKIREAIARLETERNKRRALEKYETNMPVLRRSLLERLLSGDGAEEVAAELLSLGVVIPSSGLVIYAKSLISSGGGSRIKSFCDGLLSALSSFVAVGCLRDDNCVVITDMSDVSVMYSCIEELLECTDRIGGEKFAVGVSLPYTGTAYISEAYKQATALCADVLFPFVNNVRTADDAVCRRSRLVEDALMYIAENYGGKVSVRSAAEKLFVSESHLMHEIKEVLGKTFNECLTEYRMLKAKELLAEGRLRVNEIASHVGYSDVRYFSRVFGDTVGMSPKEYADSIRNR